MAKDKVSASTAVGRSELGSILGVSSARIGQLEEAGVIQPTTAPNGSGRGKRKLYHLGAAVQGLIDQRVADRVGLDTDAGGRLDASQARARKDAAQARLAEQTHRLREGGKISIDDYREASVRMADRFWMILHGCRNAWIDRIVRAFELHPDSPIGAVDGVMSDMQLDVLQQLGATRASTRIGRLHTGADPEESEAEKADAWHRLDHASTDGTGADRADRAKFWFRVFDVSDGSLVREGPVDSALDD